VRNSKIFRESIHRYHEEKVKAYLRELYDIPKDVVFFPASRYDHEFARKVLIERSARYSFVHIRLLERAAWEMNNENESMIAVVIDNGESHVAGRPYSPSFEELKSGHRLL